MQERSSIWRRLRRAVVLTATCALMVGTGAYVGEACNLNYCTAATNNCLALDQHRDETCCVDSDGDRIRHCATCTRDLFECWTGPDPVIVRGAVYNCRNPGAICL